MQCWYANECSINHPHCFLHHLPLHLLTHSNKNNIPAGVLCQQREGKDEVIASEDGDKLSRQSGGSKHFARKPRTLKGNRRKETRSTLYLYTSLLAFAASDILVLPRQHAASELAAEVHVSLKRKQNLVCFYSPPFHLHTRLLLCTMSRPLWETFSQIFNSAACATGNKSGFSVGVVCLSYAHAQIHQLK